MLQLFQKNLKIVHGNKIQIPRQLKLPAASISFKLAKLKTGSIFFGNSCPPQAVLLTVATSWWQDSPRSYLKPGCIKGFMWPHIFCQNSHAFSVMWHTLIIFLWVLCGFLLICFNVTPPFVEAGQWVAKSARFMESKGKQVKRNLTLDCSEMGRLLGPGF